MSIIFPCRAMASLWSWFMASRGVMLICFVPLWRGLGEDFEPFPFFFCIFAGLGRSCRPHCESTAWRLFPFLFSVHQYPAPFFINLRIRLHLAFKYGSGNDPFVLKRIS